MVFVILESYVWFPMMFFFLAEAGCALIQMLNVYERTTLATVRSRFVFAFIAQCLLLGFLFLQDILIDSKYRGQGITYHYWLFRVMIDIPVIYFTWSFYQQKYELDKD